MTEEEEEARGVAQHLLLNAPPGEFTELLEDVAALTPERALEGGFVNGVARARNAQILETATTKDGARVVLCREAEVTPTTFRDTQGKLYLSLTQFNTDSDVMLMFLSRLALVLTEESPDWRDDTYWLLDNAPYHRSKEVREHLLKLGVKVILSGQYAYEAAPVELFFNYYKQEQQNPEHRATGKT